MAGTKYFPLLHSTQTSSAAHLGSYSMGIQGSFGRVKVAGCEYDHSPPSISKVSSSEWRCISDTPYASTACRGTALPLPLIQLTINWTQNREKCTLQGIYYQYYLPCYWHHVSVTNHHNIWLILLQQAVTADLTALFKTIRGGEDQTVRGEELF